MAASTLRRIARLPLGINVAIPSVSCSRFVSPSVDSYGRESNRQTSVVDEHNYVVLINAGLTAGRRSVVTLYNGSSSSACRPHGCFMCTSNLIFQRSFAAGPSKGAPVAKKKKGEAQVIPVVAKELREKSTIGANILKTGTDPPILEDSAYPSWIWNLLDKSPALSELERRDPEGLQEKEIMRLLKLDNRRRIKENNAVRSKE